jgi:hypothetical protein
MKFLNVDTVKVGLEMGSEISVKTKTEGTTEGLITLESLKAAARELQKKPGVRQSRIKICPCNASVGSAQTVAEEAPGRRG